MHENTGQQLKATTKEGSQRTQCTAQRKSATEYVATFYLNDATHGRRQQLHDLALDNKNLQEWYRKEELLKRSPTLPRTYQTTVGNDGNSPKKLTIPPPQFVVAWIGGGDGRSAPLFTVAAERVDPITLNDEPNLSSFETILIAPEISMMFPHVAFDCFAWTTILIPDIYCYRT
ncbi:putative LRR receptor-like serine/threonine-protein kinase [Dorcoceras hygrometricum]|uniref:Putative LRR receptor-like serine/threonine-protein kinase n=1 Tax=Dorcoceras hygrometricum TaxID=472368 RepID=A0A2Z7BJ30_9LAMI|nr:putative LRR receptor-like serine/threonine-protein kinase [Dorcoceras hygrometricum]